VKLADPATRSALPSDVPPAENVMLPDGKPVPELGVTFAVSTTGLPSVGAVGDTESVVVVEIAAGRLFPPPQPIATKAELNAIIVRARRRCRRRRGNKSTSKPARLPVAPAPSHPVRDARALAPLLDLT